MAIPAKRFQTLTGELDSAVLQDMVDSADGIYNSVNNELKMLGDSVSTFIEQATENIPDPQALLDEAKGNIKDLVPNLPEGFDVRSTKALIGDVKNIAGQVKGLANDAKNQAAAVTKAIDKTIKDMLPDIPGMSSTVDKLSQQCKNSIAGFGGLGKPFDLNLKCGGKGRKSSGGSCNSGAYGDVINKATGGDYQNGYKDLNAAAGSLYALSKFGYNLNMCGVFGTLANNPAFGDSLINSKVAAGLAGELTETKNMLGMTDLANAVNVGGMHPWLEKAGLAGMTFSSTKITDFKESELGDLKDRLFGAADTLEPSWNAAGDTVADLLGDSEAVPNLGEIMDASMMGNIPDINALDDVVNADVYDLAFDVASDVDMSYNQDLSDLAEAFI